MKILIVCSGNSGGVSPFIQEQADSLKDLGVDIDYFLIQGKGIFGYLKNYFKYRAKINQFKPDIVHAHYGLSGMFAVLQRKVPVITTYHGNDINPINKLGHSKVKRINLFSYFALQLSAHNIFVSEELYLNSKFKGQSSIISCGVNLDVFHITPINEARKLLNMKEGEKYVLFSSGFDNPVKNYALAKKAVDLIDDVVLVEMKGYKKDQVALLYSACDVLLVTSNNESGPLVVKEAMACGCPIVSTHVGDVEWVIGTTAGCFLTSFDPNDIATKIKLALNYSEVRSDNRARLVELGLDIQTVAKKVLGVYKMILELNRK